MSDLVVAGAAEPPGSSFRFPPAVARRLESTLESLSGRGRAVLPDPDDRRDPRAAEFARYARSQSTRDKYRWFLSLYLDWCSQVGRRDLDATPATLEAFAIYLASWTVRKGKNAGVVGMAPASIRLALAAIRTYHRVNGINPPDLGLADEMLKGHANRRAAAQIKDDQGAPGLRLPTLYQMAQACDLDTVAGVHDLALLSCGWATMGRRAELARIGKVHVTRDEDDLGIKIFIGRSKTDQLGKGRTILVPYRPDLGIMCPATNILRWDGLLGDHGIGGGGFFRGIDKHGHINGLPGYGGGAFSEWMHPTTVERVVADVAARAAVKNWELYSAHSLRRGGATDLYAAGVDILAIARQGGWGDRSPVIFRYIDDFEDWERNALTVANFSIAVRRQRGH